MFRLGQSVSLAEATPAAVNSSRRRALLALLPTDAQILACLDSVAPTATDHRNAAACDITRAFDRSDE